MTSHGVLLFSILLICPQFGTAQVSDDWQRRFGQPVAERYALIHGFILTVFYSSARQTCKVTVEPTKPESQITFDNMLNEIVPMQERGKKVRSIEFSGLIASIKYERVTITLYPESRGNYDEIKSAIIAWEGVSCLESGLQDSNR
jgi:hypothetical protein